MANNMAYLILSLTDINVTKLQNFLCVLPEQTCESKLSFAQVKLNTTKPYPLLSVGN